MTPPLRTIEDLCREGLGLFNTNKPAPHNVVLMWMREHFPTIARAVLEQWLRTPGVEKISPGVMKIVTEICEIQHAKAQGRAPLNSDEAHAHVATLIDLWNRFVCRIPELDEYSMPVRDPSFDHVRIDSEDAGCKCRKCPSRRVVTWESGDNPDYGYQCADCGHTWYVDGPDA